MTNPNKHDSKLPLGSVLELIWYFLNSSSRIRTVAQETKHSTQTIVEWFNTCRSVCEAVIEKQPKMFRTKTHPIQIDESYFSGKHKYSRGRLLEGDYK